jgi:hypothetical protein
LQYVSLHDSCAFTILVTKPIKKGEELFADYGTAGLRKENAHVIAVHPLQTESNPSQG